MNESRIKESLSSRYPLFELTHGCCQLKQLNIAESEGKRQRKDRRMEGE